MLLSVSDRRRRYILSYLYKTDSGSVTVEELVGYVVDREARLPSSDLDSVVQFRGGQGKDSIDCIGVEVRHGRPEPEFPSL